MDKKIEEYITFGLFSLLLNGEIRGNIIVE